MREREGGRERERGREGGRISNRLIAAVSDYCLTILPSSQFIVTVIIIINLIIIITFTKSMAHIINITACTFITNNL